MCTTELEERKDPAIRGAFFRDQHDGIEISMKTVQHRVHGLFSAGGLPACADGQPDEVNVAG